MNLPAASRGASPMPPCGAGCGTRNRRKRRSIAPRFIIKRLDPRLPDRRGFPKGVSELIRMENPNGAIEVYHEYFSNLIGYAASSCYGVAGMAVSSTAQGLASIFGRDKLNRGVKVRSVGTNLVVDLHIIVTYGVNISEIVKSIIKKVRYTVEEATGLRVENVNVFVDGMKTE